MNACALGGGALALVPAWLLEWDKSGLVLPLHVFVSILIVLQCLNYPRPGTSVLLWIFVAWSLPVAGPLLYLAFGVDRVRVKGAEKAVSDALMLAERQAFEGGSNPASPRAAYCVSSSFLGRNAGAEIDAAMSAVLTAHPLLCGNRVQLLRNGDEAFPAMFEAIASAKHHVHLQTFIFARDTLGRRLMNQLATVASRGVQVRLLVDRVGSNRAVWTRFFRRYRRFGIQVAVWHQANPLRRQFQLNLRNHRKILIVDGAVAFTGGINIHEQNLTVLGRPGIRDFHFRVDGPFVPELQYTFLRDWCFVTGERAAGMLAPEFFPPTSTPSGTASVRLVNGGPSSAEQDALMDAFFLSILSARKSLLLATPYFVPTPELVLALRAAALRGVDVRLVAPRKNNHPIVRYASHALYERLLSSGVRIFERNPPFAHTKALLVDDDTAFIGSANLDSRSLRLSYETNLFVHDHETASALKAELLAEIEASLEIDAAAWNARPMLKRVLENLAYLMSPML